MDRFSSPRVSRGVKTLYHFALAQTTHHALSHHRNQQNFRAVSAGFVGHWRGLSRKAVAERQPRTPEG